MEAVAFSDPNWILVGPVIVGAFVGIWRAATRYFARRRDRQDAYERLHCDTYGWPEEVDEYGNITAPARPGSLSRIAALERSAAAGKP